MTVVLLMSPSRRAPPRGTYDRVGRGWIESPFCGASENSLGARERVVTLAEEKPQMTQMGTDGRRRRGKTSHSPRRVPGWTQIKRKGKGRGSVGLPLWVHLGASVASLVLSSSASSGAPQSSAAPRCVFRSVLAPAAPAHAGQPVLQV